MGSVFDPEAGRFVRAPEPPARRSNPAIPQRPDRETTRPVGPPAPSTAAPPPTGEPPGPEPPGVPPPSEPGDERRHEPDHERRPGATSRPRRWAIGLLVAGAFVGGVAVGVLGGAATVGGPAPDPASAPPLPVYQPGVHVVGDEPDEMSAGRYVTSGPPGDASCATVRISGFDGRPQDVIAEREVDGPATLRVVRADAGVVLEGPCTWTMG
ncbi:hypothetical protein [Actinomycetospora cinnamomea]|uniref:Uncharacterized protein n=1 Tax=Actinomycetospora cinnamomea TaxID=663609 RepID=A0A2U1EXC7_9PSEU|nr:hypothetical protein [Actinomycetospora cinnamomea]PVZ04561.1 hypothetical protein C8D89_11714 [Actinomycetospora cinnamomea]